MQARPTHIHICHIVCSMADAIQNEQVFANIRQFGQPEFEHTLIVLKRSKILSTKHLPANANCLELDVGESRLMQFRECKKALTALEPDVCMTYGGNTYPMQWAAKRLGIPVKLHVHRQLKRQRNALSEWFHKWTLRTLSHSSDFIVAPSDEQQSWLTQMAKIPKSKIKLIRNGIDSRKHCPTLAAIDNTKTKHVVGSVTIPAHRLVIGLNLSGQSKRLITEFFDEYFAACSRSPMFAQQTLLLAVGHSPYLCQLQQEVDKRGIAEKQVSFTGHLNDLYHFLSHIDIYVSLQPQEQRVSLLEAMSMGLAISSIRPTIQDHVDNENHPIYWSTNTDEDLLQDQLLDLFLKSNKRLELGRASRRYVQDKHSCEVYDAQYRALLTGKASPSSPLIDMNAPRNLHTRSHR